MALLGPVSVVTRRTSNCVDELPVDEQLALDFVGNLAVVNLLQLRSSCCCNHSGSVTPCESASNRCRWSEDTSGGMCRWGHVSAGANSACNEMLITKVTAAFAQGTLHATKHLLHLLA